MKSFIGSILLVLAMVTMSFAYPIHNGDVVSLTRSLSGAANGDFQVEVNHAGNTAFATFCVERNTHFSLGQDYYVTVNDTIENGYVPLSNGVKYLFWHFSNNSLVSTFDVHSAFDVADLQDAIWMLQGQMATASANRFISEVATVRNFEQYDVSVMNLWTDYNAPYDIGCGDRQSQLVISSTPVPEPASLALFGVGLVALGLRKRFKK